MIWWQATDICHIQNWKYWKGNTQFETFPFSGFGQEQSSSIHEKLTPPD